MASVSEKHGADANIGHVERVLSRDSDVKNHMNYDRIDKEVAAYASATVVNISEEENLRLRKLVDKRVLFVSILGYLIISSRTSFKYQHGNSQTVGIALHILQSQDCPVHMHGVHVQKCTSTTAT